MNFDPISVCRILGEEGVEYLVVGGFASLILGSPLPTEDIDVLPNREFTNLERLAVALTRMNARIRTEDEPVDVRIDAPFLLNMPFMLNLVTGPCPICVHYAMRVRRRKDRSVIVGLAPRTRRKRARRVSETLNG